MLNFNRSYFDTVSSKSEANSELEHLRFRLTFYFQ